MYNGSILRNLDAIQIQEYQQNRYPWFFVDFIEEVLPGKYARGYKNFTYNEWFFPPHFEHKPIVPGCILIESLVQVLLMTFLTLYETKGKVATDAKCQAVFKREIKPGDRMDIVANLDSYKRGIAKGNSSGYVGGELACKAEYIITVPEIMLRFRPRI
ncbi:MAG: beta-hydroxyacyl-ACP dehydratase [Endomicrobium sp.]|jgi:3-hydroxyacyl-[acyl-carrier-protein] dehydratase|nr:beta-hydroxyacyl-ACP dehydratase [Endomicrobium sp.]